MPSASEFSQSVAPFAGALATLVSVCASACIIAFQIRGSRQIAKANFINELNKDMAQHNHTHIKLYLHPEWPPVDEQTGIDEESMVIITSYINFFEKVKLMLDNRVLDLPTVDKLYAFRFFTLTSNKQIAQFRFSNQEYQPYLQAFLELHEQWYRYRKHRGLPIPNESNQFRNYDLTQNIG